MEEALKPARAGWQPEETEMLWQEIRAAAENGAPLRGVFERMGRTLGRKPNSVRNYYYMQLRDRGGEELKRAAPFSLFTEEEIHHLLREVLMARGEGKSVRACVTALSGGEKTLMLRYQNKYRALLRKRPQQVQAVYEELRGEGLPCFNPLEPGAPEAPVSLSLPAAGEEDPLVRQLMQAARALAARTQPDAQAENDRLKVQRDLLLMDMEDLQLAAQDVIHLCKDFLGREAEARRAGVEEFCQGLAARLARLESAAG